MAQRSQVKTTAELYLCETYSDLIGKLKDLYETTAPPTSCGSVSDDSHILYFGPFMNHNFEIGEKIHVKPKYWALAFMEDDLKSITTKLLEAILCCNSNSNLEEIRAEIMRAAIFINDKYLNNLDPWSYSKSTEVRSPSSQESTLINSTIDDYYKDAVEKLILISDDLVAPEILWALENNTVEEFLNVAVQSVASGSDDIYNKVFVNFISHLRSSQNVSINPAHIAQALTKGTVPINTDIFVDALQISNHRWTIAFSCIDVKSIAGKLFNKVFCRDFIKQSVPFRSIKDICPVKLLALYRATKFLHGVRQGSIIARTSDFSSEIPEHNVYPNREERELINLGLIEAAENYMQKYGLQIPDVNIHNQDINSTNQQPTPSNLSKPQDFQNFDFLDLPSNVSSNVTNWIQSTQCNGNFTELFETSQFSPIITPISAASGDNVSNDSGIGIEGGIESGGDCSKFGSELVLNKCSEDDFEALIGFVKIGEHAYPSLVWKNAISVYKNEGTFSAGKYLFRSLFTDEEQKKCTISGRKRTPRFSQERVDAVLDALEYFEKNIVPSHDFPKELWTKAKRKQLRTNIFVETGSQTRNSGNKTK